MKLIEGYFVDVKDRNVITVIHTDRSVKLGPGNYTVIIDNIFDRAFTIAVPKPADAVGCFYSIVVLANPSGAAAPADISVRDGNGVSYTAPDVLDAYGENILLWSDGFYFYNIQDTS